MCAGIKPSATAKAFLLPYRRVPVAFCKFCCRYAKLFAATLCARVDCVAAHCWYFRIKNIHRRVVFSGDWHMAGRWAASDEFWLCRGLAIREYALFNPVVSISPEPVVFVFPEWQYKGTLLYVSRIKGNVTKAGRRASASGNAPSRCNFCYGGRKPLPEKHSPAKVCTGRRDGIWPFVYTKFSPALLGASCEQVRGR